MICKKCGSEISQGTTFCPNCGCKITSSNDTVRPGTQDNRVSFSIDDKIKKSPIIKKYIFIGICILLILFVVGKIIKRDDKASNYKKYLGEWILVGDIAHPDGQLYRTGKNIEFTKKGIDCTDLFGQDSSWSYYEDLKYFNEDENDYFVDFTGDPMGFRYEPEKDQIVLYTPSSDYPSENPYEWNSRFRFERE